MQAIIKPKYERLWLVIAGLLPLILCLIFTFIEARQAVKRQQEVTASMLLSQAEHISDMAWNMSDRLRQFNNRSCNEIKFKLQQFGTLYPYFRSVGVTQDDTVFCSSAFGDTQGTLETMMRQPMPAQRKAWWSLSVAGTFGVQDRPAVVFMREIPGGFGTYAVVDGQYLIDVMQAAGTRHGYHIAMRFGGGYRIISGEMQNDRPGILGNSIYRRSSERYPIAISITAPRSEALQSWQQVLFTFLPMAIILSLLFIALTSSWLKRKSSWRDEIRRAISRGEFSVHYQPVMNLQTESLAGAEALMRWQRSDGSWVRPDIFIATAEQEGMIVPLTRHLLALVSKDCASWQVSPGFHIGINVAAEHLQHQAFVEDIRQFAASVAHLQPAITLELTERSLIVDGAEVARKLAELRQEGMHVAIDDFGTGHCSLSYLQTFPIDYLKIDKGFVNAIEAVDGETPVLDAIIQLSHRLALEVVAEGVENAMQLEYLKKQGVAFIQGFYYARPLDNAALLNWVKQQENKPR